MELFSEIRPFTDAEAADAIATLLADDGFVLGVCRLRWPVLSKFLTFLLLPLTRYILSRKLSGVVSLDDFQWRMQPYLSRMAENSMASFSAAGTTNLLGDGNYLFISNHRDIIVDAAMLSHVLFHQFHKTPCIAVGDNLLKRSFVGNLLRLNKCFIVSRNSPSLGKKIAGLRRLSAYIYYCLTEGNHCVWLAQKGGRAKDGLDKTDPAIIKMLAINKKPDESFGSYIKGLKIVPVSISYEYDPCDLLKAKELYMLETKGEYIKAEDEDFTSMGLGILGYKGDVHLHIGPVITNIFEDAFEAAQYLDKQIIGNYRLHPSNIFAYQRFYGQLPIALAGILVNKPSLYKKEQEFMCRLNTVPKHLQKYWLKIYANPVVSFIELRQKDGAYDAP